MPQEYKIYCVGPGDKTSTQALHLRFSSDADKKCALQMFVLLLLLLLKQYTKLQKSQLFVFLVFNGTFSTNRLYRTIVVA